MIKRFFVVILLNVVLSINCVTTTLASDIPIYLNGLQQNVEALFHNGRTMLPLRSCADMFGMSVYYDSNEKKVYIYSCNKETYEIHIGSNEIIFNNKVITKMDMPPLVRNEIVYLPIRCVEDIFYVDVEWDNIDNAIYIIAEPLIVKNNTLLQYRGNEKTIDLQDMDITTIGDSAFWNQQINEIILPDVLEKIEFGAFYNNNFSEIIIPENVREIEDWAFCNCLSLKYIEIPPNVTKIGSQAFISEDDERIYDLKFPNQKYTNNIVIGCSEGSIAEQFAKIHKMPYKLLDKHHYINP